MRALNVSTLVLPLLFSSFTAMADHPSPKTAPKPPAPKLSRADLNAAVERLRSGDETKIRQALDDLRVASTAAAPAAPAVIDLLSRGMGETTTQQAIDTLGDLEASDGSPVLAQYAVHRTVALRRAAVKSLTRTKGPAATQALRRALSDADALVRSNAAAGLGAMRAKEAVPDLFVALDHKVNEAAASIGQLCNADQCEQLAAKLGKLPFDVVSSGLDQVLARPVAEATDDTKVKILGRLRELGTAEANRYLKEIDKRLKKDASPRVKLAIEQAVKATMGGSQ